ncbi:nitroreductase family protein [Wenxinia saemankumensis]|uniref:Putative NAD(P)H nitroreductase n=1 Tax=Wenxinia saemankumensis TaxID=1447782 RepID=A0A1M6BY73_9RHOB|nr:nitroreductase [Wenxinia saemankumensis]SHI53726.1 Nitroreductase [Wenxinia saemankumensis]
MPRNDAALDFLLTRRSRPSKILSAPVPDRAALETILTAGLRVPDHKKLEPWRLVVLGPEARARLASGAGERGAALGIEQGKVEKVQSQYADSPLAVAVIAAPVESPDVPLDEQLYSAGAVCLSLVNAALAAGWGAQWLTGWAVHDADFAAEHLGCGPGERVAGVIHIGTESSAPPDRPRPDLSDKVTWLA